MDFSQCPCQRMYEINIWVGKKLPVNGRHTFPNSAKIIVHVFLPALRFFSFLNTRSKPTAQIRSTVGCFCFIKEYFHAVVKSSSFDFKQNREILYTLTCTFSQ